MIAFPYAKINLGLNVVRKRPGGYHDIESVLVPIPLRDALEVVVDPSHGKNVTLYTRSGIDIPGEPSTDLCMKAVEAIRQRHALPGLRVHLHKRIPLGAGLGGGSSDGTHTLLLLNDLLELRLKHHELHDLASGLGSDCPFFLDHLPQLATGRGEILEPISLDLKGLWLVLVNPGVHVPTSEVFAHTAPTGSSHMTADMLLNAPMERWRDLVPNVMEEYVFSTWPIVAEVLEQIRQAGAEHAAMSGSGSSVFGLFRTKPPVLDWPAAYSSGTFRL